MSIESYRDLNVWQESLALAKMVFEATQTYPQEERFGLSAHTRKSAVSVMSNIAEGRGRRSTKDFIRFLNIAYGSLTETESQVILAAEMGFLSISNYEDILEKAATIGKMINGLRNSLEKKLNSATPESRMQNPESLSEPVLCN